MKQITTRTDPTVQRIRKIRAGKLKEYMMCEGPRLIKELVESKIRIEALFCTKERLETLEKIFKKTGPGAAMTLLAPDVMEYVSDLDTSPGAIAIVKRPHQDRELSVSHQGVPPQGGPPLILIVHQVQLPQNVGALLRTAEASGVTEVWTTEKTCDPYSPKALRGSAGSAFRIKIRTGLNMPNLLKTLISNGVQIVGATQNGRIPYHVYDWKRAVALVIGSEGSGFKKEELEYFNETICVPMRGKTDSLNVGIASAVCLFEAARQRSIR